MHCTTKKKQADKHTRKETAIITKENSTGKTQVSKKKTHIQQYQK
jgi:hypothetical protein